VSARKCIWLAVRLSRLRHTGGRVEERVKRNKSPAEVLCRHKMVGAAARRHNSSTVVHFVGLCARYLTPKVYQIVETAWKFWPRDGLSRRRSRVRAPSLPSNDFNELTEGICPRFNLIGRRFVKTARWKERANGVGYPRSNIQRGCFDLIKRSSFWIAEVAAFSETVAWAVAAEAA
jgi:hypothetical protein